MSHRVCLLIASVLLASTALAQEPVPAPAATDSAAAANASASRQERRIGPYEQALPRGAERDVIEAAQGCDLADLEACTTLGAAYVEGDGVLENRDLGLWILHDACSQGFDTACAMERHHASF